jgi:hypothetical protein
MSCRAMQQSKEKNAFPVSWAVSKSAESSYRAFPRLYPLDLGDPLERLE